jgi:Ala-tRNA(Pro) deacylase
MAITHRLQEYLDARDAMYSHSVHRPVATASEVAAVEHIPSREVAKTIVYCGNEGFGMAVVPGDCHVDLEELRIRLGLAHLRLATEKELTQLFPDIEIGAMPPFGNLYHMPVYVDSRVAGESMIAFNAGTHRDMIHMRFPDFKRLVKPSILPFSRVN